MDNLFLQFQQAYVQRSGTQLSATLIPVAPSKDPDWLRRFFGGSNSLSVSSDIRSGLLAHTNTELRFTKGAGQAWTDVYAAFWKAIGEIVSIADTPNVDWSAVYDAWKDVTNALIKGYSGGSFEAWTVPCLYVVGRYLRLFAIKADKCGKNSRAVHFSTGVQDDIASDFGKNEKLEDAARVINRMFTLCISDR